jgi:hypothetical protein
VALAWDFTGWTYSVLFLILTETAFAFPHFLLALEGVSPPNRFGFASVATTSASSVVEIVHRLTASAFISTLFRFLSRLRFGDLPGILFAFRFLCRLRRNG